VLKHWGVIDGKPDTTQRDGSPTTRHMMVRDSALYSFSPAAGLFEPTGTAGQAVKAGEPAGWLHFVEDIDRDPIQINYQRDGRIWMAAGPGRVARGDVVAVVMQDYDAKLAAS